MLDRGLGHGARVSINNMSFTPTVSVVMSTHDDASRLGNSIDSVLAQEGADFEFIIVNDGSLDPCVGEILTEYARRDGRIRIMTKKSEGLTRALIAGCAVARGTYIARLDVGDRYLPGKLARQIALIAAQPKVTLVSCGVRYLYTDGTLIREDVVAESPDVATRRLRADNLTTLRGLCHHGTALFRRVDYVRAGGYRSEFFLAQDIDLWMRLTDLGHVTFLPDLLYEAELAAGSLSGTNTVAQRRLAGIAIALRQAREQKMPETVLLEEAGRIGPLDSPVGWRSRRCRSSGHYLLGNLLFHRGHMACRRHLCQAVLENPFNLRAWALLAWVTLRRYSE